MSKNIPNEPDVQDDEFDDDLNSNFDPFERHRAEERKATEPIIDGKINYAKRNPFANGPGRVTTVPPGWYYETKAIELAGIDVTTFDWMIRYMASDHIITGLRNEIFISDKWVELYKMDPDWATGQLFKRFLASPDSNGKKLEYDMDSLFSSLTHAPSKKQMATLATLLDNPLITSVERWLIELFVSDGRITKKEISSLFDHFYGMSVWNGSGYDRWGHGVLHARQRTRKSVT